MLGVEVRRREARTNPPGRQHDRTTEIRHRLREARGFPGIACRPGTRSLDAGHAAWCVADWRSRPRRRCQISKRHRALGAARSFRVWSQPGEDRPPVGELGLVALFPGRAVSNSRRAKGTLRMVRVRLPAQAAQSLRPHLRRPDRGPWRPVHGSRPGHARQAGNEPWNLTEYLSWDQPWQLANAQCPGSYPHE
jgi:hypothetical protein